MGQNLSEPVTEKDTSLTENSQYKVGCSSMQGWRNEMEDSHTCLLELTEDKSAAYFAVFDGHGGHDVAKVASHDLHKMIVTDKSYRKQRIEEAIINGYLSFDQELLTKNQHKQSGSTAISILIKDNKMYCGNVGDSRAIASVAGDVQVLSHDHKPNVYGEHSRIISAGGWVEFNRVNGNLALSRALGDFVYKRDSHRPQDQQIVIAKPDVISTPLTIDHEFVVLACDGIWDVMTNEEVVEFVRSAIADGMLPDTICEQLMTRCLAPDCRMGGVGCDNMTVIVVCLLQGGNYDELCARCRRRSVAGNSSRSLAGSSSNRTIETSEEDGDEWYDCCEDEPPASSNGHEEIEAINTTTQEAVKVTQEPHTVEEQTLVDDDVTDENTHVPGHDATQYHNSHNGTTDCSGVQPCDDVAQNSSSGPAVRLSTTV